MLEIDYWCDALVKCIYIISLQTPPPEPDKDKENPEDESEKENGDVIDETIPGLSDKKTDEVKGTKLVA